MIAVVQRVTDARVKVGEAIVGEIGAGLLALVSIVRDDDAKDVAWMATKLTTLRVFRDASGEKHFDRSVMDVGGSILLVSNFTIAADTKRGRRPSFDAAAPPQVGRGIFEQLIASLLATGVPIATGQFGGDMRVSLTNDGPGTFIVNSRGAAPAAWLPDSVPSGPS